MISMGNTRRLMRFAAWLTPHVQRWWRNRKLNETEGERHLNAGNFSEAERYLQLAVSDSVKRRYPTRKRLNLLIQLSEAQRKQSKLAEAAETMQAARLLAGTDKSEFARCLDQLAAIAADLGNYTEAQRLLQESLSIEESFKPPHPAILAVRTNRLSMAHLHQGDRDTARKMLERSLKLHEQGFGPEHAETGRRAAELGALLIEMGEPALGLVRCQQALAVHEKSLGHDSPEVAADLKGVAECYEHLGDLDKAAEQYERAIKLLDSRVGADRMEAAEMMLNLARLCFGWQKWARAEELLPQAIPVLERTPDHRLAAALTILGMLYERRSRYEDAEPIYERALAIWEDRIYDFPNEAQQTMERLAAVVEQQGRAEDADAIRARIEMMRLPG